MKKILIVGAACVAALVLGNGPAMAASNLTEEATAASVTSTPPAVAKSPLTGGAATNEPTIITADNLHGDYAHNMGTFEGNVLVVDPRMTVRADKMVVFFGSTNVIATTGTTTTKSSPSARER